MRFSTVVRPRLRVVSSCSVLHVEERGSGPAVVLLHGAPTAPEHLWPLGERLSRSYRVLVVHLPGYRASTAIEPPSLERSHALVEEALLAQGVEVAHFVGFSGGAYRAFALALRGIVRAQSVVSLGGSADFAEEEKKSLAAYASMLRHRADVDAASIFVDVMLSPEGRRNEASVADVRSWANAIAPEALAHELDTLAAAPDLRPQLASPASSWPDVPVLLRVGMLDAASPPERSRRAYDALVSAGPRRAARVCLEEVEGAGHALLCEDLDGTAAALERHLELATSA